jgi:hypothetical protein
MSKAIKQSALAQRCDVKYDSRIPPPRNEFSENPWAMQGASLKLKAFILIRHQI